MALLIQNSNGLSASVLQTLRSNSESFLKENKLYTLDPTSKGTIIHTLKYTSGYIFRTEISSLSDSNGFYNVYWQEHIYYDSTLLKIDNINYKLDLFANLNDYIFGRFNILYGNGTALDKENDIIDFSVAPDFLRGYNAGGGDDVLLGSSGTDLFYGGVGNDLIDGSADHDTIYGNIGDDQLIGDTGNDYLVGDRLAECLGGG